MKRRVRERVVGWGAVDDEEEDINSRLRWSLAVSSWREMPGRGGVNKAKQR